MKKTISLLALSLYLAIGINLNAQTYKFGHIDSQKLITSLPESEQAQKSLEAEQKAIRDQLGVMQAEYEKKVNDFVANDNLPDGDPKKWSDIIKEDKEKEIQSLQQRAREFEQTAGKKLQEKQAELFKPILEKVQKAIKEIAKENKFTYIFDVASLLYHSEESIDITSMVQAKLAVK